jgi:thioredoxin reductase (NADPH)
MDTFFSFLIAVAIIGGFLFYHLRKEKKKSARVRESAERGKLRSDGPQSQHPHIDNNYCIGCAACTMVCPEGDVLGMVGGKAMIINGHKCIGHSL